MCGLYNYNQFFVTSSWHHYIFLTYEIANFEKELILSDYPCIIKICKPIFFLMRATNKTNKKIGSIWFLGIIIQLVATTYVAVLLACFFLLKKIETIWSGLAHFWLTNLLCVLKACCSIECFILNALFLDIFISFLGSWVKKCFILQ